LPGLAKKEFGGTQSGSEDSTLKAPTGGKGPKGSESTPKVDGRKGEGGVNVRASGKKGRREPWGKPVHPKGHPGHVFFPGEKDDWKKGSSKTSKEWEKELSQILNGPGSPSTKKQGKPKSRARCVEGASPVPGGPEKRDARASTKKKKESEEAQGKAFVGKREPGKEKNPR